MKQHPVDIKADTQSQTLAIAWNDKSNDTFGYVHLRGQCSCAECVDEWTGVRRIDPASVAPDIVIDQIEPVGNYAMSIIWSDGHSAGLYTWERLIEIAAAD